MRKLCVLAALGAFVAAGCGDSGTSASAPAGSAAPSTTTAAPIALSGTIAFRRYFTLDQTWAAVFTVGPDGKPEQVTDPQQGVTDEQPAWSPNGTLIAFTRCQPDALCHIFRVAPDGSGLAPVGSPCRAGETEQTCPDDGSATFSPDSKWVVFTQSTGGIRTDSVGEGWIEHSALAVMRTDGSKRRVLYRRTPYSGDLTGPSFSPDGRSVVYEQVNSGFSKRAGTRAVFVIGIDGSSPRQLTPWAESDGDQPAWSPDGRWIVFHSHYEDGGQGQYFLIHPDGSGRRQLTHFPDGTWVGRPSFSPDGESIAFAKGPVGANAAVYTMRLDGSHIQQVTHSAYSDSAAAWGSEQ